MKLVIGNKNYSSWSLRAVAASARERHRLRGDPHPSLPRRLGGAIARFSPAGQVPVLLDDDGITVWDSLAIIEHVRERWSGAVGWPHERAARARARSIAAEMHSGFLGIARGAAVQRARALAGRARATLGGGARQVSACSRSGATAAPSMRARVTGCSGGSRSPTRSTRRSRCASSPTGSRRPPPRSPTSTRSRGLPSIREWVAAAEREPESLDFIDQRAAARRRRSRSDDASATSVRWRRGFDRAVRIARRRWRRLRRLGRSSPLGRRQSIARDVSAVERARCAARARCGSRTPSAALARSRPVSSRPGLACAADPRTSAARAARAPLRTQRGLELAPLATRPISCSTSSGRTGCGAGAAASPRTSGTGGVWCWIDPAASSRACTARPRVGRQRRRGSSCSRCSRMARRSRHGG